MPLSQPLKGWDRANRMTRLLQPSDKSLVSRTNAISNDHPVDDFATGDTSPPTRTVILAVSPPNKKVHRTHEAMTAMTRHTMNDSVKIESALLCSMLSIPTLITRRLLCAARATYTVAALNSDRSTSVTCENSTDLTTKRRAPWRNTTCVRSSLV